jgi:hypothetical protein
MQVHDLIQWTHDEEKFASGLSSGYYETNRQLKRAVYEDSSETKDILDSTPKPSQEERDKWDRDTAEYVAILELLVSRMIVDTENPE